MATQSSGGTPKKHAVKRSVFRNLLISMIAFGVVVGIIFPPFARIVLGSDRALSPQFFAMCILAGFLVGLVNFQLFRVVVSRELARVAEGMRRVLRSVAAAENTGEGCNDDCKLAVTSSDAIGDIEHSFNDMTEAIARRLKLEVAGRSLFTLLSASVELKDVSEMILKVIGETLSAKAGLLYGDKGEDFELLADFGFDKNDQLPRRIDNSHGPVQHALASNQIMSLSPERDGLTWLKSTTPLGSFQPKNILILPLSAKQRPVGIVILAMREEEVSEDHLEILEALRNQGAPYLHNAILHQRITDLAAIDDLTLILNRRFGLRRLKEEFSRSVRHGVPISVVMMDIDHFKSFNDTFGHDAGDAILKMVARTIENNLRAGDVICRYGGEEFLIVAPGTGMNDSALMAERLRRLIETNQLRWGPQVLSITVSMGIATWPMARVSISEELVTAADKALYAAKSFGRNQVAVHRGDEVITVSELELETIPQ